MGCWLRVMRGNIARTFTRTILDDFAASAALEHDLADVHHRESPFFFVHHLAVARNLEVLASLPGAELGFELHIRSPALHYRILSGVSPRCAPTGFGRRDGFAAGPLVRVQDVALAQLFDLRDRRVPERLPLGPWHRPRRVVGDPSDAPLREEAPVVQTEERRRTKKKWRDDCGDSFYVDK